MKCSNTIAILMATYNGEKYISQQIDSILAQSYTDWMLFIHDDGSVDNTLSIIKQYCSQDKRIVLVDNLGRHLGAGFGFMALLSVINADLYMFCDQDDVWKPEKVKKTYDAYLGITDHNNTPVVVHCDMTIVDDNLNIMAESYWRSINMNPDKINNYDYLCISCYTNGNTMLFNQSAKKLCYPMFNEIIMHDKYVSGKVLKHNGIIYAIHEPLIYYRQHQENVCGIRVGKANRILNRLEELPSAIKANIRNYRALKEYDFGPFWKYVWVKLRHEFKMHFINQF